MKVHKQKKNELMSLIVFLREEKFKFIFAVFLMLLTSLSYLSAGVLSGEAVSAITNSNLQKAVLCYLIYLIVSLIFDGIISPVSNNLMENIESRLARRISYKTYEKILDLESFGFEDKTSGELVNRVVEDSEAISFTLGPLVYTLSGLITTIVTTIYIFMNSIYVGLEIMFFILLLYFVIKYFNKKLEKTHKERRKVQDKFTSQTTETIRGIREIKTLGVKQNLLDEVKELVRLLIEKSKNEADTRRNFNISTGILRVCLEVGTFMFCVLLLYYGKITISFFIAMTYYVYRYTYLIDNMNNLSQNYQKLKVALGRINEILENRTYKDEKFGSKTLKNTKGVIEFKNVEFAYPNEEKTLKNFNLVIEPNKKIAIVGRSGQGKSTLFNLLTRIFDPKKGKIMLDGVNIKDLTEESLRENISIIRQEPFIFNRSIKDNFKIINKKIKNKSIKKYASMAYIDDYIESLPKGYNTILGEGGVNLSGGQKQRLSIARTLSKNSKVILFDEATSALDNESQEMVKKAINDLVKDHTVVIVAHRLSTIMDADVIHVVDKGEVVASGTHDELMNTSSIYKNLYETESLNS